MKRRALASLLFLHLFLFYLAPQSHAISCVYPRAEGLMEFDAVIVATVTSILDDSEYRKVEVDVIESYKINNKQMTLTEITPWGSAQLGETYLFGIVKMNNEWQSSYCSTIHSNHEAFDILLEELSSYPNLKPQHTQFHYAYLIAGLIVTIALIASLTIYYIKRIAKK